MKRSALIPLVVAALLVAAPAKDFEMPRLQPAAGMAAHDAHPNERLAIGADPYDTAAKASVFHVKILEHSVLPVLIVFTNDGDESVVLNDVHFELVTRDRAKAEPYTEQELERALTSIQAPRSRPQDQLPIPFPGRSKPHGGLSQKQRDELGQANFAARAIEPHSSQQGFLFFDTTGLDDPAQGARLFVTGVRDGHGHELMYFEVPLGNSR